MSAALLGFVLAWHNRRQYAALVDRWIGDAVFAERDSKRAEHLWLR